VGGFYGSTGAIVAEYSGLPSSGEHLRLYHNNGNGTFTDLAPKLGLNTTISGMAGNFGDLDNDGFSISISAPVSQATPRFIPIACSAMPEASASRM
jgi:hypothetical protein